MEKPTTEIRDSLKTLGLKWNPLRKEWEGYVEEKEIEALKKVTSIKITRVHSA